MIKAIFFDLDGVLVDTKLIHFEALNQALIKIIKKKIIFKKNIYNLIKELSSRYKIAVHLERLTNDEVKKFAGVSSD